MTAAVVIRKTIIISLGIAANLLFVLFGLLNQMVALFLACFWFTVFISAILLSLNRPLAVLLGKFVFAGMWVTVATLAVTGWVYESIGRDFDAAMFNYALAALPLTILVGVFITNRRTINAVRGSDQSFWIALLISCLFYAISIIAMFVVAPLTGLRIN